MRGITGRNTQGGERPPASDMGPSATHGDTIAAVRVCMQVEKVDSSTLRKLDRRFVGSLVRLFAGRLVGLLVWLVCRSTGRGRWLVGWLDASSILCLVGSFDRPSDRSSARSFVRWLVGWFVDLLGWLVGQVAVVGWLFGLVRSLVRSLLPSLARSLVISLIRSIGPFDGSFVRLLIRSSARSFVHSFIHSAKSLSCAPPLPRPGLPTRHLVKPPDPLLPDGGLGHLESRLPAGAPLYLNLGFEEKRGVQERPHPHEKRYPIGVTAAASEVNEARGGRGKRGIGKGVGEERGGGRR